jgi:uncharacterized protein YkvS
MNEIIEFNDWVNGLIEDLANNDLISLVEFDLRFNQIEFERKRVIDMMTNLNNLLDDGCF